MAVCANCGATLPAAARFCPSCAEPVASRRAAEERKLATILFADLVGSTALAHDEDPERTRALLDRFYDAMSAEIERAGGTIEKFAGDAVMATFGAPTALEDHAERALHAALSMRRRLEELFGGALGLRIGVNTGDVVVGRPRQGSSFVSGDAVNVAARLEQAAAAGEILVGERTAAAVRGAFELGEPRTVDAKGKASGLLCRPLRRALSLMRPRGVAAMAAAFVGRERELAELEAEYRLVADRGVARLVLLVGDSGIGKTRLARELWGRLADETPEPLRRTGRCLSYGRGITYWPFGEILKEHFELRESDSPEVVLRRLGERQILGLALGLDVARDLHPLAARDRLHEAWVEFLSGLARDRPVVLLLEDLHWAEPPFLELVERLVTGVRGPLLVVATARPELLDSWSWSPRVPASQILLGALSDDEASGMVDQLPAALRSLVVETAEGNPFFVEELVASLVDQGVLVRENGRWTEREPPPGFVVPDTVQAVLAARIDLLAPAEKAALQAAAVIGRTFWSGPVYELLEALRPDLRILEEREFILRQPGSTLPGQTEFAIKHALTREVAYASLPKARRARLHAAFAGWIERVGEGRDDHAPLLAHHYSAAVRPEDADLAWRGDDDEVRHLREHALRWLERAADLAVAGYALGDAVDLLEQALALDPSLDVRVRAWRKIGFANALRFDGEAFWTAMLRSLDLDVDPASRAETLSVLAFQTSIRSGMWKRRPESEIVEGWIEQAIELAQPESIERARALAARAFWRPRKGREAAREASRLAERLGDLELRSYAWAARAAVAFDERQFGEAASWAERRFDLLPEITDPDHVVEIHESAIPPVTALGRIQEARRLAERHFEYSSVLTPHHRVHGLGLRLEVAEAAGDWQTVRSLTDDVRDAAKANEATPCIRNPRSLLVCAVGAFASGDADAARTLERAADEWSIEDRGFGLASPRVRLALLRADIESVGRLVDGTRPPSFRYAFGPGPIATWLDGLAVLRARDVIEEEAPRLAATRGYLEPFALRALAVARGDEALVARAQRRFHALGLAWHARQTRALLSR
jgi:class 3 adenylate cyclase/tetratricopeptide (TPR) repeat protein